MGRNFSKYDNVMNEMQFIIIHLKNNTVSSFNSVFFSLSLSLSPSLSLFLLCQPPVKRNGQVSGLRVINYTNHPRSGKMLN